MKETGKEYAGKFRLLVNSRWNLLAFASMLVGNFVTLPVIIRLIGLEAFGHAGLILAMAAPLSVVGVVIGQATTREVVAMFARGDAPGVTALFNSARILCLVTCVLGVAIISVAGPHVIKAVKHSSTGDDATMFVFFIAGIGWAFQQFALVYQSLLVARQDFAAIARGAFAGALVTVIATITFTAIVPGIPGYLAGVATSFLLSWIVWVGICRNVAGAGRLPGLPERRTIQLLLRFGRWQIVTQLAGAIGNQADRYALGMFSRSVTLGQYGAANRLSEAAYIAVIKMSEVLFPHFSATAESGRVERARFYLASSWIVVSISAVVLGPIVPLAHALLERWVNLETAEGGGWMLQVLVLGGVIGCGSNVFSYCAMGVGRPDLVARITLIYALIATIATFVLVGVWGARAAGVGLLVASVVRVWVSLYLSKVVLFSSVKWSDLVVSAICPIVVVVACVIGISMFVKVRTLSWVEIVLSYMWILVVLALAVVLVSMMFPVGRKHVAAIGGAVRERFGGR